MEGEKSIKGFQVFNLIFFLGVVAANALANILPIGGRGTGAISDSYPNLFVPVPLTFAVWAVIYFALLVFIIYQFGAFTPKTKAHRRIVRRVGGWFIISCIANTAWIVLWHYGLVYYSLIAMGAILLCLIAVQSNYSLRKLHASETWFFQVPFGLYLGWITVATIANVTAALVNVGWDRFGLTESLWVVIMVAAAAVIAWLQLWVKKDVAFGLVIIWALAGILSRHLGEFGGVYRDAIWALIGAIVFIGVFTLVALFRRLYKWRKKKPEMA